MSSLRQPDLLISISIDVTIISLQSIEKIDEKTVYSMGILFYIPSCTTCPLIVTLKPILLTFASDENNMKI